MEAQPMKIPPRAPRVSELIARIAHHRVIDAVDTVNVLSPTPEYLHWDRLIRLSPPAGLTHEEWWLGLKLGRSQIYKTIPLRDKEGQPFRYLLADPIPEQLHAIDLGAGGGIGVPEPVTNPTTRDRYHVSSLIEEAITSSQLEGATTTREVAREMIQAGRPP